jgi:arylsulfatase A-like enzyme
VDQRATPIKIVQATVLMTGPALPVDHRPALFVIRANRFRTGLAAGTGVASWSPAVLVALGLYCGLLAGIGELLLATAAKVLLHHWVGNDADAVWMLPLVDAIPATSLGIFFAFVAAVRRSWVPDRLAAGALVAASASAGYYFTPKLHPLALGILAIGLGVRLSAPMARRGPALGASALRGLGIVALSLVVTTAVVRVASTIANRDRDLSGERPDTPNVLLLVLDTVRAWSLGLYGSGLLTTPQIEQLARSSTVFDAAYSTSSWTLPAHASLFTGLYPAGTGADWESGLAPSVPTIAEELASRGYETAGFSANLDYVTREYGLDRGFRHFEDYGNGFGQALETSALMQKVAFSLRSRLAGNEDQLSRKRATDINAAFLSWQASADRPFFAFLNYYDAHEPYLPPAPFAQRFGVARRPIMRTAVLLRTQPAANIPASVVQAEQAAYEAAIAYLDHAIGDMLASCRRGVLDRTLVIITADHGEEFGEHGLFHHSYSLYPASLRVPLIVRLPTLVPGNLRVPGAVSIRDVPATIMDLVKAGGARFPGASLARFWQDGAENLAPDTLLAELRYARGLPDWFPVPAATSVRSLRLPRDPRRRRADPSVRHARRFTRTARHRRH